MERGQGKGTDTLATDNVFTRKEYIERESAFQALCEAVHAKDGNIPCRNQLVSCLWTGTRTQKYAEKILAIPAADVRPVVLCKHCKHSAHDWQGNRYCGLVKTYNTVEDDWFCANGERGR